MNGGFKHVVFDLDGTLADTAGDLANAANYVRRAHAMKALPVSAVCELVGQGARTLVARLLPGVAGVELDDALQRFLSHYQAHILDETTLYPGIAALLVGLAAAGMSCSVLSNKPVALCHRVLDGLGVGERFVAVLGGDSLAARKPDPCGIRHLQMQLRLERTDILLVGDSPVDRDTATSAGVAFCGVAWGFASTALAAASGVHIVATPGEILGLIGPAGRPVTW